MAESDTRERKPRVFRQKQWTGIAEPIVSPAIAGIADVPSPPAPVEIKSPSVPEPPPLTDIEKSIVHSGFEIDGQPDLEGLTESINPVVLKMEDLGREFFVDVEDVYNTVKGYDAAFGGKGLYETILARRIREAVNKKGFETHGDEWSQYALSTRDLFGVPAPDYDRLTSAQKISLQAHDRFMAYLPEYYLANSLVAFHAGFEGPLRSVNLAKLIRDVPKAYGRKADGSLCPSDGLVKLAGVLGCSQQIVGLFKKIVKVLPPESQLVPEKLWEAAVAAQWATSDARVTKATAARRVTRAAARQVEAERKALEQEDGIEGLRQAEGGVIDVASPLLPAPRFEAAASDEEKPSIEMLRRAAAAMLSVYVEILDWEFPSRVMLTNMRRNGPQGVATAWPPGYTQERSQEIFDDALTGLIQAAGTEVMGSLTRVEMNGRIVDALEFANKHPNCEWIVRSVRGEALADIAPGFEQTGEDLYRMRERFFERVGGILATGPSRGPL